jgi:hypothetical protein
MVGFVLEVLNFRIILPGGGGGGDTQKHVQWQTSVLAVRNVRVILPEGIG